MSHEHDTFISLATMVWVTEGDVFLRDTFNRRPKNAILMQCNSTQCRAHRFAYFNTDGSLQRWGPIFYRDKRV